jgi:hypothetical protein
MKRTFAALVLFFACHSLALAQVPTADVAREAKETQTAGCVTRAAASSAATVQPSQGVKGSLVAPSAAAPSAAVGDAGVMGLPSPSAAMGTNSGLGTYSGSSVSGIDLSALTSAGGGASSVATLGQSSVATVGQVVGALSSLSSALQSNSPALNGAGAAIGSLSAAQAAWNQNTSARIGAASVWGQAIQTAALTLQLRNLMLLQQTARASGQAAVMNYDAAKAALVTVAPAATNNSTASVNFAPTTTR